MSLIAMEQDELQAVARTLGRELGAGDVLALTGPMGAGKTTFTRAVAEGMNVRHPERVRSPTFNICLVHDGPLPLVHVDLFRLGETPQADGGCSSAFSALGLGELIEEAGTGGGAIVGASVVIIEWADLCNPEMWGDALRLEFERPPEQLTLRHVHATAVGPRSQRRLDRWRRSAAAVRAGVPAPEG